MGWGVLGKAHMTQDLVGIRILFSVQMQPELFGGAGGGVGRKGVSLCSPHLAHGKDTGPFNSGCTSVPGAGPALTPRSNHSVRQQTWSGDRGAGNSDSRRVLAGPLPPPYLLSVTLEGPHPPGTQACPIRASFLPPQAKSQGKPSPPPFTRDWVSPGRECSSPRDRGPIPRTPAAPRWLPRQHSRSPAWWATPRAPCPSGSENVYFCICQFARQLSVTESTAQEL